MNLLDAERFIKLYNDQFTAGDIAREMGLSASNAHRKYLFLKVNSNEEFIDQFVYKKTPDYTPLDIANIVEFLIENNLNNEKGFVLFRVSPSLLYKKLTERRNSGKPLYPDACASKVKISAEKLAELSYQADSYHKPKNLVNSGDPRRGLTFLQKLGNFSPIDTSYAEVLDRGGVISGDSRDAVPLPLIDVKPLEHPIGKATVLAKSGRAKKIMRNKKIEAEKKMIKAAKRREEEFLEQATNQVSQDTTNGVLSVPQVWVDPNPPHPAKEYFEKGGNVPAQTQFDPDSEGFSDLPADIQIRSLRRSRNDLKERFSVLKKVMADSCPAV